VYLGEEDGMSDRMMHIGEAAARAGVNIRTLHYYEGRGLLPKPLRTEGNYRLYSADSVLRVRFVKRAQDLGFTLEEIRELLDLRIDSKATCADVLERADAKIADVEERIRALRAMKRALKRLTDACSGRGPVSDCPILDSLGKHGTV
jgi:MerR family mercuric resistance operon transcriptional regulator